MPNTIQIEVVFATAALQKVVRVKISEESTIQEAIQAANLEQFFPEYAILELPVGIFGKRLFEPANYRLQEGDRLELYRPLSRTPNQKRIERAKKG